MTNYEANLQLITELRYIIEHDPVAKNMNFDQILQIFAFATDLKNSYYEGDRSEETLNRVQAQLKKFNSNFQGAKLKLGR